MRKRVASIHRYMEVTQKLASTWRTADPKSTCWYRGHRDASWPLVPSVFRPEFAGILAKEVSTTLSFQIHAPMFREVETAGWNPTDWLAAMQHYGIPTRLMDWSSRALTGLYFALTGSDGSRDACVWMFDPVAWNRQAVGDEHIWAATPRAALVPALTAYFPAAPGVALPRPVAALTTPRNNRRIALQQGSFTLHGSDLRPLDVIARSATFDRLTAIVIPARVVVTMREEMLEHWISETDVFPELDSLAKEIVRAHR